MQIFDYEVDDSINVNGTSLQGYVTTTYDKLVEVFGKPTYTDADPYEKVACEWTVEAKVVDSFADDEEDMEYKPFTVYCWKTDGRIPTEEHRWNVGGYDFEASDIAQRIIDGDTARA
jgi:hypothetical protein